jgi:molybdopterin synthase sulfur carrier subunit
MATVKFTSALKRFFPALTETSVEGESVSDVMKRLEQKYPGISHYLTDDAGRLRQHVNVFVNNELIRDREKLQDAVRPGDVIVVFQALSGG